MAHHFLDLLREFLANYGYWAVALTLLLENAGLPVPGETILLLASISAYTEHRLQLPYIILVGICAATLGDNIGFAVGYWGGRRLLLRYLHVFRISQDTVRRAEELFQRYGAATVFFARFVAGLRIVAGPLAGVLRMHWKKFFAFNFLGAALWVSVISSVGYFFGKQFGGLERIIEKSDLLLAGLAVVFLLWLWYRVRTSGSRF